MTSPQWPTLDLDVVRTLSQYAAEQHKVTAKAIPALLKAFRGVLGRRVSEVEWLTLLHLIFDFVFTARKESAELARQFYDAQRDLYIGETKDAFLDGYEFEQFEEAMRPALQKVQAADGSNEAVSDAVLRAVKEIENGGRRTIITAVDDDPETVGWARVATGRETCGFCLMLVSRGVNRGSSYYSSARSAGLNASDEYANKLYASGDWETIGKLMEKWHPGCDCKVVPVYDHDDWPGKEAQRRAIELWNEKTKGFSSKDALNAFRRAVESGELDLEDFAAAV